MSTTKRKKALATGALVKVIGPTLTNYKPHLWEASMNPYIGQKGRIQNAIRLPSNGIVYKLDQMNGLFYEEYLNEIFEASSAEPEWTVSSRYTKEELKKLNMETTRRTCAECGVALRGPTGFTYCPVCEVDKES